MGGGVSNKKAARITSPVMATRYRPPLLRRLVSFDSSARGDERRTFFHATFEREKKGIDRSPRSLGFGLLLLLLVAQGHPVHVYRDWDHNAWRV
ncbi:hypothetical protein MRX96_052006 [Rhipicephalus microplus]